MKRHDDELQRLRDQLRLRIDTATKSVAEALQAAADLLFAMVQREADSESRVERAETAFIPKMMTSEQAAEYLGVTPQTLAVWRSTRRYPLPFVKVGRNTRYRKSDLDNFIQHRTRGIRHEDDSP